MDKLTQQWGIWMREGISHQKPIRKDVFLTTLMTADQRYNALKNKPNRSGQCWGSVKA